MSQRLDLDQMEEKTVLPPAGVKYEFVIYFTQQLLIFLMMMEVRCIN